LNVLLSCAGRRNYLIEYFRSAPGVSRIIATDASEYAPALADADESIVVPLVSDPDYVDVAADICRQYQVGLLISLNDLELPVLAEHRERFASMGVSLVVSSPDVIRTCFDKWATVRFLESAGIEFPRTYVSLTDALRALQAGQLQLPLVIKPRWGTASIGIEFVDDEEVLVETYEHVRARAMASIIGSASTTDPERCLLIQERLEPPEYGLDVVNDLSGRYVTTFARRKLAMRAGETDRAVTVDDRVLSRIGARIGTALAHVGNLDCDIFMRDGEAVVLEMNPRFGGGYPFSHAAGADVPAALVAWAMGREPEPSWLEIEPGVAAAKCDRVVVTSTTVVQGRDGRST